MLIFKSNITLNNEIKYLVGIQPYRGLYLDYKTLLWPTLVGYTLSKRKIANNNNNK